MRVRSTSPSAPTASANPDTTKPPAEVSSRVTILFVERCWRCGLCAGRRLRRFRLAWLVIPAYRSRLLTVDLQDTQLMGLLARADSTVAGLSDLLSGLISEFARRNHTLYLVRGSVRHAIFGRTSNEMDVTIDARPQVVHEIHDSRTATTWDTGIDFGTISAVYKGQQIEITTLRPDLYDRDSRN